MTARWGGSCCWPLWNWQESTDPLWVILSGGGLAGWKGTQEIGDNPGRGWLAAGQTLMDSGGFFPYHLGLKLWHLGLGQRTLLYTLCYYAKDDTETDADSYETQGITWLPLVSISPETLTLQLVALCKAVWRFSESCHAVFMNSMKRHSVTFIVLVNPHQRWKQTRNRVCFHLWCELTLAFAFIFGVNWLWCCGVTAPLEVFFHEIKCNGMTSFMEFMIIIY